jgi:hypothetical protein
MTRKKPRSGTRDEFLSPCFCVGTFFEGLLLAAAAHKTQQQDTYKTWQNIFEGYDA